jgi:hypothetical protein
MSRRGGKARGKQTEGPELTDRERALRALRKALDSNNAAACVAASKALIDLEPAAGDSYSGRFDLAKRAAAREELARRITAIALRRGDAGMVREIRAAVNDGDFLHRGGTTLADVIKLSLSIGIDPITGVQDIDRAEELLRRLDVPEDDAAWDNLRSYRRQTNRGGSEGAGAG